MATYNVTAPDGSKYKVTAPDDATQDQVMAYVQQQHAQSGAEHGPWDNYAPQPSQSGPWQKYARHEPENPYAQFVQPAANPYAQFVQHGATREQISQAFHAAQAAGNTDDARQLIGYAQQHGMTIAPQTQDQVSAADAKQNAATVAGMPWYEKAALGAGHGFAQLMHGAEQIGDAAMDKVDPQAGESRLAALNAQIATNTPAARALMQSGWAQAGNVGA